MAVAVAVQQLRSYIAPAAPATRRPATGDEPFLRPELGFTPRWYRQATGFDFGQQWHHDVDYRREAVLAMREELRRRFPGLGIGGSDGADHPLDLLSGVYGGALVAAIYGVPLVYAADNWPACAHASLDGPRDGQPWLSDAQLDCLEPPDLSRNPVVDDLLAQLDRIEALEDRIEGFINPQGILNNAQRLRGERIFFDLLDSPERVDRLCACLRETMEDLVRLVRRRQAASGVDYGFFTVSNCLVNLVGPEQYERFLLPHDIRLAETFGCLGIHNCAWRADPYLEAYASIPNVGYIDLGLDSDLERARQLFPRARRALMYRPTELATKSLATLRADLEHIAAHYGPCDLVLADIDLGVPDERVREVVRVCRLLSEVNR